MNDRKGGNNILRLLVEVVLCLLIAIVLVGVVQQFFLAPVAVSGVSMMPTINSEGDKVFVQKKFFKIERDCIVVFYRPNNDEVDPADNPANSISVADFFNSLPFVNKIPNLTEESDVSAEFTCVIKRVIGIPGDQIEIRYSADGTQALLYRNNELVNDFLMTPKRLGVPGVNEIEVTVGENELFVLGDNRNNSFDSEDYGCIQSSWLMGRVILAKIGGEYKRDEKLLPRIAGF